MADSAPYPWELGRSVHLRNDRCVSIRAIRPDDEAGLRALFDRLSPATVFQRFFRALGQLPDDWFEHFANVDYTRRLALVAEAYTLEGPRVIGVARYEPTDVPDVAEVAVVIEDAWQGQGLGHVLLDELFAAAEARGIHRFQADVLSDNRRMLRLLSQMARIESSSTERGVTELTFVPRLRAAVALPFVVARSRVRHRDCSVDDDAVTYADRAYLTGATTTSVGAPFK